MYSKLIYSFVKKLKNSSPFSNNFNATLLTIILTCEINFSKSSIIRCTAFIERQPFKNKLHSNGYDKIGNVNVKFSYKIFRDKIKLYSGTTLVIGEYGFLLINSYIFLMLIDFFFYNTS